MESLVPKGRSSDAGAAAAGANNNTGSCDSEDSASELEPAHHQRLQKTARAPPEPLVAPENVVDFAGAGISIQQARQRSAWFADFFLLLFSLFFELPHDK